MPPFDLNPRKFETNSFSALNGGFFKKNSHPHFFPESISFLLEAFSFNKGLLFPANTDDPLA